MCGSDRTRGLATVVVDRVPAVAIDMPRTLGRVTADVFDEDVEVNQLGGWREVLTTS
jgi:hypothetical protein